MSGSNIFMQLVLPTGPVLGEGLLQGWEGSIELREFEWGMAALRDPKPGVSSLGGAISSAASSLTGMGKPVTLKMEPLVIRKRFDVSSSYIHTALDQHLPVISLTITVLHIKHGGREIHQPAYILMCNNGYFADAELELVEDGRQMELVETVRLNFQSIKITYLAAMGQDNLPTTPFLYTAPQAKMPSL